MSLVSLFHDVIAADKKHRSSVLHANKGVSILLFRLALVVRCETDDDKVKMLTLSYCAQ